MVHITLYYLRENVALRNENACAQKSQRIYDHMHRIRSVLCVYHPRALFSLHLSLQEITQIDNSIGRNINTIAVSEIITQVHVYLFIAPFHLR